MLSYVHAFHAGGEADVLKHALLSLLLSFLLQKEKPFCILDAHAGSGIYSLFDERAAKTNEAANGILRFLKNEKINTKLSEDEKNAILPYISAVLPFIKNGEYPGTPAISSFFQRETDELHLAELHPRARQELKNASLRFQKKPHIHEVDSWKFALFSTPPKIKRGLLLLDPSFEDKADWEKCAQTVEKVRKRWSSGIIFLWYPILPHKIQELSELKNRFFEAGGENAMDFWISSNEKRSFSEKAKMEGSGVLLSSAPFGFFEKAKILTELVSKTFGDVSFGAKRVGEKA